ncbi:hypothetical protein ACC685_38085, partial [Rhizobium ruizarguesonis]
YLIDDPIFGRQQVPLMKFETDYRGSGIWTHTYYVKNCGAGGGAAPPVGQQSDYPDSLVSLEFHTRHLLSTENRIVD